MQELTVKELETIDGGGFLSMVAGGLAGALIGVHAGMVAYAVTGDVSTIGKGTIIGASAGMYVGAGCPLP